MDCPQEPLEPGRDLGLAVLCGRLVSTPELIDLQTGSVRLIVLVRSDRPRPRVDVFSVDWPHGDQRAVDWVPGSRVWVTGHLHREFEDRDGSSRSRITIKAVDVCRPP